MPHKTFTREDVAKNNSDECLWFIIDSKIYDVTDFIDAHPGGEAVLKQVGGTDATDAFYNLHRQEVLQKYSNLCIGTVDGEKSKVIEQNPGDLSVIPYGEPTVCGAPYILALLLHFTPETFSNRQMLTPLLCSG
jgi:cytochrome b involved in lipid metabolism